MKIKYVLLLLSIFLTGCVSNGYGGYSQNNRVPYECKSAAKKQVNQAYVQKMTAVRFADESSDVAKANSKYNKKMESISNSYDKCVNKTQKKAFESRLKRKYRY